MKEQSMSDGVTFSAHHSLLWLSKEEAEQPQKVITDLFATGSLEEMRQTLWELLNISVRTSPALPAAVRPVYIQTLFTTRILKLLEAMALVITKHTAQGTSLQEEDMLDTGFMPAWVAADEQLSQIIWRLRKAMDIEKIYLLGKFPLLPEGIGEEYHLLVLVKNTGNRPMEEYESLITNRTRDMLPVHYTINKISQVNELLRQGNYFLSTYCVKENLVFDAQKIALEIAENISPVMVEKARNDTYWIYSEKAEGFLDGAKNYFQQGEYALGAFMLHQAVENGLNSLLVPLMQYRLKNHNLHKLMRYARLFSMEVFSVFPRDTEEENTLFQLLQRAYIHARYKDSFKITKEQSEVLLQRVTGLLETVRQSFQSRFVKVVNLQ